MRFSGRLMMAVFALIPTSALRAEEEPVLPEFAKIPAGAFWMGGPARDRMSRRFEQPRHEVRISRGFEMSVTEVTRGQFGAFSEATGYRTEAERDPRGGFVIATDTGRPVQGIGIDWRDPGFEQSDEHPVIEVSWIDAEAYCAWLGTRDGHVYRLPTEAEWEYACRAGTTTRYWFGDDPVDVRNYANIADSSLGKHIPSIHWAGDWNDEYPFTAPVKRYRPNAFGLYDMHGNVWEWCADWHSDSYYSESPALDPRGPSEGKIRSIRGGGWYDPPDRTRSATRAWFNPTFRYCQLSGFRVVRELPD